MIDAQETRLLRVFNPYFAEQYERVLTSKGRFVHYTSAEAAMKMLTSKTVWMRNARTMNDFSEIEYGSDCLRTAYNSPIGDRFKRSVESLAPGIIQEIENLFNGWSPLFPQVTYLACVSEHDTESEDLIGRLSMWRAYGRPRSVALVLNNKPFLAPTDVLNVYTSPVLYADHQRFNQEFDRLTTNVEKSVTFLRQQDKSVIHDRVFSAFLFATLCTKHPGFREEREWRVIHTEKMQPSTHLTKEIEVFQGSPQFVYKLPLRDIPGEGTGTGFFGAEIVQLLDRIIIGPSDDGVVVREAFVHLLQQSGITDATDRVLISGIPLR